MSSVSGVVEVLPMLQAETQSEPTLGFESFGSSSGTCISLNPVQVFARLDGLLQDTGLDS